MNNEVVLVERGLNKIVKGLFVTFDKSVINYERIKSLTSLINCDTSVSDAKRLPELLYTSIIEDKNQLTLVKNCYIHVPKIGYIEHPRFVFLNKDFDVYYKSSKDLFGHEFEDYGNENVYGLMYTHSVLDYTDDHENIKTALNNLASSFNEEDSVEKIEFIKKSLNRVIPEIVNNPNSCNHIVSGYFGLLLTDEMIESEDLIAQVRQEKTTIVLKRPIVAHLKITEFKNHNFESGISWLNDKGAYTYESLTFVINAISVDSIVSTKSGLLLRYYFVETIPNEFNNSENKRFMQIPHFDKNDKSSEYQANIDYIYSLLLPDFDDNTVIKNFITSKIPIPVLKILDNYTFIAGGYLRDLYSVLMDSKPLKEANFKDIDIFCTYDANYFRDVILVKLKLHFELELISTSAKGDSTVYRFTDKNGIVYDLVNFPCSLDASTFIETFDFTINMVAYNGTDIIFPIDRREIVLDHIKNKTLVCSTNHIYFSKPVRAIDRLSRLKSKGYNISKDESERYISTIIQNRVK